MTMSSQLLSEARENGLLFASVRAPAKLVEENAHYKVYNVHGSMFEVDAHYELLMGIGFGAYGVVCAAADLRFVSTDYTNNNNSHYNKFMVEGERNGNVVIRHRKHRCYSEWEAAKHIENSKLHHTTSNNTNYNYYTISKFNVNNNTENNNISYNNNINYTEYRQVPASKVLTQGEQQQCKFTESLSVHSVPTLEYEPFTRRLLMHNNNDTTPSPFVAIKKIPKLFDDLIDARRVLREIKTLRFLRGHPNVVRLLDVSWRPSMMELEKCNSNMDNNHNSSSNNVIVNHVNVNNNCDVLNELYITTELLDTDLATLMRSEHTLDEEQIRYICYQIIRALVYIHSSGVIHRDIKPGNILVNGNCEVKLCDFGLARGGVPPPSTITTFAFHNFEQTSSANAKVTKSAHLAEQMSQTTNTNEKANSLMCDNKEVAPCEDEEDEASLFEQYQFRADDMEFWSCDDRHGKESTVQKQSNNTTDLKKTSNSTTKSISVDTFSTSANTSASRYNSTDNAKQKEGQRKYNDREEIEWEPVNQDVLNECKSQMYTLTDYVVTRYYRAPELLVMGKYNHAVDMWAVGCILGELILRRPLFMGANFLTQLALILQTPGLRGLPTSPEALEEMFDGGQEGKEFIKQVLFAQHHGASCNNQYIKVKQNQMQQHKELQEKKCEHIRNTRTTSKPSSSTITITSTTVPKNINSKTRPFQLRELLTSSSSSFANNFSQGNIALLRSALFDSQHVSMHAMQLLSRLLSFNPRDRPTALEALQHPYFAKVFNPKDVIVRDLTNDMNTTIAELESSAHLSSEQHGYVSEIAEDDMKCYRNYVIEEIAPPYLWAFDHRVASREGLQSLFCEEVQYYADVKRQWRKMKEQESQPETWQTEQ